MTDKALFILSAALLLSCLFAARRAPEPAASAAPKFALLVGVGDYEVNKDPAAAERFKVRGKIRNLAGPANDVADMRALLVGKFGFADDAAHIRTLVNREATRAAILDAFQNFLVAAAREHRQEKPTVVFYFAGHGRQAADVNGDEGDGADETLVPADSDVGGVNRDIIDDELDELLRQLVPLTPDITFIIDSCHSGTVTRSLDESLAARHADERDAAHQPPAEEEQSRRGERAAGKSLDLDSDILSWSDRYSAVTGCLPHENSYEDSFPAADGSRVNGLMTHALIESLNADPHVTYRRLMQDLANKVTHARLSQNPQVEGDLDRPVFGGSDARLTNSVAITSVAGKVVRVAAGRAQGVRPGTFIAIYPTGGAKPGRRDAKLATARVTAEVSATESAAEILDSPANRPFTKEDARAFFVAPDFGEDRLRVALDISVSPGARAGSGGEPVRKISADVAEELKGSGVVTVVRLDRARLASSGDAWDVTVARGRFGEVFPDYRNLRGEKGLPADDEQVYYIAARDGRPRHYFWVSEAEGAADGEEAASRLAAALESIARQDYLRRLVNRVSPLDGKVRVTFLRLVNIKEGPDPSSPGRMKLISYDTKTCREDQGATVIIRPGDRYQLSVENLSDADIYVSALMLGSSGGIFPMIPARGGPGERLERNRPPLRSDVYRAGPPPGFESYKVIATKVGGGRPAPDFDFLYQRGITRSVGQYVNPFAWLADGAPRGAARGEPERQVRFDDWTTERIDVEMRADAGTAPLAQRPCTPRQAEVPPPTVKKEMRATRNSAARRPGAMPRPFARRQYR